MADEIVALEADAQHARRLAQNKREIVRIEWRHIDRFGKPEQYRVGLKLAVIVGALAGHDDQAFRVARKSIGDDLRETLALGRR